MDEEALKPFFERFGPIYELTVIRDKATKAHRGGCRVFLRALFGLVVAKCVVKSMCG